MKQDEGFAYTRKIGFRATDSPGDDASQEPFTIITLNLKWSSRVALNSIEELLLPQRAMRQQFD